MVTTSSPYQVLASGVTVENDTLLNNVADATDILSELFEVSYEKVTVDLENEIAENKWDYATTMEGFYEQGNPFSEIDYPALIAAYCMATEKGNDVDYICNIDLVKMSSETDYIEESEPLKMEHYADKGNGIYEKDGIFYITESGDYETYKENVDGTYSLSGTEYYELSKKQISYGRVTLSAISPEELLESYGIDPGDVTDELEQKKQLIINGGASILGLLQSTFVQMANSIDILTDDEKAQLEIALSEATGNRQKLLYIASTLIGQVPYQWGGKSKMAGYDTDWWLFDENGEQKGLDCSGYVQWVYRTAGYSESMWNTIGSSGSILANCETISESELQIGDIGVLNEGGTINHVGIYIGNGYYIHCSSGKGTVVVNKNSGIGFKIFKRVPGIDDEQLQDVITANCMPIEHTEADTYLLAQTIMHEARGEGLNCWIAVGEVIVNRINSAEFSYATDVGSVVYAPGQFQNSEDIVNMVPTEAFLETAEGILNGTLRILNNPNVLFFRNPELCEKQNGTYVDDGVLNNDAWGDYPFYKRINNTVFYLGR